MATTKELLEKAILRLGSRGSRGSGEDSTSITVDQSSESAQYFVSSADGFVQSTAVPTADSWEYIRLGSTSGGVFQVGTGGGGICMVTLPVKKGETFRVDFNKMSNRSLTFLKSVGGGA